MLGQINLEKQKMINYFKVHKLSLKKILASIFNKKIIKITYLGNYKLNKMPEYRFNVLKFNVVLENYINYTAFIKLISLYKVKESLFCYWLFCEENYSLNTKFYVPKANIVNYKQKNYEKRYEMQLLRRNHKIWNRSLVDIINLKKYCKTNLKNLDYNIFNGINEFLFIAIL